VRCSARATSSTRWSSSGSSLTPTAGLTGTRCSLRQTVGCCVCRSNPPERWTAYRAGRQTPSATASPRRSCAELGCVAVHSYPCWHWKSRTACTRSAKSAARSQGRQAWRRVQRRRSMSHGRAEHRTGSIPVVALHPVFPGREDEDERNDSLSVVVTQHVGHLRRERGVVVVDVDPSQSAPRNSPSFARWTIENSKMPTTPSCNI
jgi:hypothetical protein